MSAFAAALATENLVLDGGLATLLEAHGQDLTSELWSARLLLEDPELIRQAHLEYFQAGAQVAISASYQASFEGFGTLGLDRAAAAALMTRSVTLALEARAAAPVAVERWVAASVGPYGAVLADGSEYRGDYGLTVTQLREWHRPRLEVLADAGADLLAVETIPCLAEVEAVLAELAGTGRAAWISLTCADGRTRAGEPVAEAFAMMREVEEIVAVGINCTAPEAVAELVASAWEASGKPVLVYPNSGEVWDPAARSWSGTPGFTAEQVDSWVAAGAAAVGGCCRVGPGQIREIAALLA
ncbi:homocysteine S-methyltransferase [Nakamurella silvestris]|nr:homocysteine S-methyltransferase [Nakamurella silvestris]